jgi:hypothetical protein
MKHFSIFYILFFILLSCENSKTKNEENDTIYQKPNSQLLFDSLLLRISNDRYKQENAIQKKEYREQFDKELIKYLDSIGVFVNWSGEIKDIEISELNGYTILSTEIFYSLEGQRIVTFHPDVLIKTDEIKTDSLYAKLKYIPKGSKVFFDGYISRNFNKEIQYENDNKVMRDISPNYDFNLLDISSNRRNDELSPKLKSLTTIYFQVFDLLRQKTNKTISNTEWKSKTKTVLDKESEEGLTNVQLDYINRFKQYLYNDFMRK